MKKLFELFEFNLKLLKLVSSYILMFHLKKNSGKTHPVYTQKNIVTSRGKNEFIYKRLTWFSTCFPRATLQQHSRYVCSNKVAVKWHIQWINSWQSD